ncbi:hypothetical protein FRC02_003103 [Tulasnella sp. 418]|nr:hypothetical protein FRC02_003103 [Tulasnella sp. 418]
MTGRISGPLNRFSLGRLIYSIRCFRIVLSGSSILNKPVLMDREVDISDLDLGGKVTVGDQVGFGGFSNVFQGKLNSEGGTETERSKRSELMDTTSPPRVLNVFASASSGRFFYGEIFDIPT